MTDEPLLPWELKDCRVPHRLNRRRARLLDAAVEVLDGLRKYWPVTVRFLHYRLVSLGDPTLYTNTRDEYGRLSEVLAFGRLRSRTIAWNAIIDNQRDWTQWNVFAGPDAYIENQRQTVLTTYNRDLLAGQERRPLLMVEKDTQLQFVQLAAEPYCVPVVCLRGQCSWTVKWNLAEASVEGSLHIMCVGDADPSGMQLHERIRLDLVDDLGCDNLTFERVVLWPEQALEMELPPIPAKVTDKHGRPVPNSASYREHYGDECWELDAVDPDDLIPMIQKAIEASLDMDEFHRQEAQEEVDREPIAGCRETVVEAFPD